MCGIIGFWGNKTMPQDIKLVAELMGAAIRHRGPDSGNAWFDETYGLALGHRRLAIVDISPAGAQPMTSKSGRYVITYNGEIYNHRVLRRELEAEGIRNWHGNSDTETLLELIGHVGLDRALQRCVGMFAFALWDRLKHKLILARDRLGEKPLYFGRHGDTFLFSSELKALRVHPDWQNEIDRNALTLLMRYNYIGAPHCIYRGIKKLLPGHYIEVSDVGRKVSEPICYWSLENSVQRGKENLFDGSAEEAVDSLEEVLTNAVSQQMEADVPLGAFLSGGYDSSLIVALMQTQSTHPVRSFTIGFQEERYDEAPHARAIAAHLGTEHTELYISPSDALAVIPNLPRIYDEPFSDSSQIPTFLLSSLARQNVKVSLSGDAGDELFCGYDRYLLGNNLWRYFGSLPGPLRRSLLYVSGICPDLGNDYVAQIFQNRAALAAFSHRLKKLRDLLRSGSSAAFYNSLVSHHNDACRLVRGSAEPLTPLTDTSDWPDFDHFYEQMMYVDTKTYLPGDILTKVDRAAMAVGLETRMPFLDHRVVEFAHRIPLEMKMQKKQSKWLLRQVLYRHIPRSLLERPKMGFGIPIDDWLRGPLRDWAETLLDESRLHNEGFFDTSLIRQMWSENLSGARRWHYQLWNVLMFQSWLETQAENKYI